MNFQAKKKFSLSPRRLPFLSSESEDKFMRAFLSSHLENVCGEMENAKEKGLSCKGPL